MDITELETAALALAAHERASLAHRLLLSLEDVSESEFDQVWGEESARRVQASDASDSKMVSDEEVALKARALLR
jgi:hypothetical protein